MAQFLRIGGLEVHPVLKKCVETQIAPGTGVSADKFWASLETLLREFTPQNEALLKKRDAIQAQIDAWTLVREGKPWDQAEYATMLGQIGYVVPEGPDFKVDTKNVDPEIATIAGPQLVVPVDKARFALNAANARWGSLLDAFYGTDAGPPETNGAEKGKQYNPVRGARVFEYSHEFLDKYFPLSGGAKFNDVSAFKLNGSSLSMELKNKKTATLQDSTKFVGYNLAADKSLSCVLLKNNGLHVELLIDRNDSVGSTHAAGLKDIVLEAAVTAIADFEDSVAAVDAEDKSVIYSNWTGLMRGDLQDKFMKGGSEVHRVLNKDKTYLAAKDGSEFVLPGRVVFLVRNVGLHMYTDAVKFADTGRLAPEGLLDLMITALSSLHDIGPNKSSKPFLNSRTGSVYIVKPKQHGPEEVAFTVKTFERAEQLMGLAQNTLKMGIMDEERRTTVNLKECIRQAKSRCIFINTGFMDRTGDEFHTSFHGGAFLPRDGVKKAVWLQAYEDWNVDIGIETGLLGVAQIGKGMWAAPNSMADMLATKGAHPKSGANCAWVPSPTAATLHAMHYHETDVHAVQAKLAAGGRRSKLSDILQPPFLGDRTLTKDEIEQELKNNAQGILGYVARWIELGVGCSSVPNIHDVGLMEDRATLRISSQHIANWLHHGIVSQDQVVETFKTMAQVVDKQNGKQAGYEAMAPDFNNNGFLCALELVMEGINAPNGLTEGSLTKFRRAEKARLSMSKL